MTSLDARWRELTQRLYTQNQFAIKLGLDSMNRALALSGLSSPPHRVVLVAGTNGKGTCASSLAQLLHAAGLRVGLYTSPHLIDLRERFRINGEMLSPEQILPIAEPILERFAPAEADPCLTFFELTTLIAVSLFAQHEVDIAIYEVGLGGRLDATNALEPELSLITSIGLDHQRYLGDTLPQIFHEKLGITREGVELIVSLQDHREVDHLLTLLPHTPLYCHGRNFGQRSLFDPEHDASSEEGEHEELLWWYRDGERRECVVSSWGELQSEAQRAHVITALVAADHLLADQTVGAASDWLEKVPEIIEKFRWPGRLDSWQSARPELSSARFLLDAAHNPDGARALFAQLRKRDTPPDVILFSALRDKEIAGMLTHLGDYLEELERIEQPLPALYLFSLEPHNARAASLQELQAASTPGMRWHELERLEELVEVIGRRGECDLLVFGSIYLLGEVLSWLGISPEALTLNRG